jgi:hypothetical protein
MVSSVSVGDLFSISFHCITVSFILYILMTKSWRVSRSVVCRPLAAHRLDLPGSVAA